MNEIEHNLLAGAMEQATDTILLTDTEGVIVYANPAAERITGYARDEILGQTPRLFKSGRHDTAFYKALWETLLRGEAWQGRFVNRRKDGAFYTEEASISPVRDSAGTIRHYLAIKNDITSAITAEAHLRHTQKMMALETLAGGVAHGFNNILYAMEGFTELLRDRLKQEMPDALHYVDEIQEGIGRATDLVDLILAFTAQSDVTHVPIRIGVLIRETSRMIRGILPKNVQITVKTDPGADDITGCPGLLRQALLNLCQNAAQAMADTGGGVITLQVSPGEARADADADHECAPIPGPTVRLTVSDTGPGIAPDVLDHIFDPFFTTRRAGEGEGMGLSIVHGIVSDHGGVIRARSEPGQGATFEVWLPRAEAIERAHTTPEPEEELPRGGERILVVDDEEKLLKVIGQALVTLGYHVTTRSDSVKALETFLATPDGFDLIITDLTMPVISGKQLAELVRETRSDIPVILISGYSANAGDGGEASTVFQEFLRKPVRKKEMARVIRRALDNATAARETANG